MASEKNSPLPIVIQPVGSMDAHVNATILPTHPSALILDIPSKSRKQMIEHLKQADQEPKHLSGVQPLSKLQLPKTTTRPTSLGPLVAKPMIMNQEVPMETPPAVTPQATHVDGVTDWNPVATLKRTLINFSGTTVKGMTPQSPPKKIIKPNLVKPKFDVKYADHLVGIGNARFLVYGEVNDRVVIRIQECDYRRANGETQNEPKMIKFSIQQWLDLMEELDFIESAIEEFDQVKVAIGGNTFVRVQPQRRRVDIREFFMPDGALADPTMLPDQTEQLVVPTRRGISLTYEEWAMFVRKAVPLVKMGSDRLKSARQGACLTYHNGQREWLLCPHCNPNGYKAWEE
jgi:hypothetical protein